jgi:hypothetical protein
MQPSLEEQLNNQSAKLDAIYVSVEKTRKAFQLVMWVSVAMVVLPLLGVLMIIPSLMNSLAGLEGLI